MNRRVSILIPAYNAAPWIGEAIHSAVAQTWADIEVIVVDDGSTDDTLAIASRSTSPNVRVATQRRSGASAARNHGLRLASGEFIQFLDADDILSPDKIAGQITLLADRPRHVASCRWGRFERDIAATRFVDDAVFRDLSPVDYLLLHTAEARMMHPAAWLVPRRVADVAGPWDERLSLNDDGEYFARIVLASDGIVFSATGQSHYRSNLSGSLSRRRSRAALDSQALATELIAAHLLRRESSPRVHRALAEYWQRLDHETYPDATDICRRAAAEALRFGGSTTPPPMGTRLRLVSRLIGWRGARRIQRLFSIR